MKFIARDSKRIFIWDPLFQVFARQSTRHLIKTRLSNSFPLLPTGDASVTDGALLCNSDTVIQKVLNECGYDNCLRELLLLFESCSVIDVFFKTDLFLSVTII